MDVIGMKNKDGVDINVDPTTVGAVLKVAGGVCGLQIGKLTVGVQGEAEEVAAAIGKARGTDCPVTEKPLKNR